jgi:uncharacterized protein (TIGR03435 family)
MRHALAAGLLLIVGINGAIAQSRPTFDVVSIVPDKDVENERANVPPGVILAPVRPVIMPGGRIVARGISANELIREAYGYQRRAPADVIGGPDWIGTERYDVTATMSEPVGPTPPGGLPQAIAVRLQTMLADRFGLKIKTETRERPIYEMVMARPDRSLGPRLLPSDGKCVGIFAEPVPNLPYCPFRIGGGQGFDTGNMTMRELAMFLSLFPAINTTVIDRTNLPGAFNISLRFRGAQQDLQPGGPTSDYPLLVDAVPEQLFLKLQRTRGPVDVLVIERVQHPTPN